MFQVDNKVKFQDPTLIYNSNSLDEGIAAKTLFEWKRLYLKGDVVEMWESAKKFKKPGGLMAAIRLPFSILRYFWPMILIAIAGAYIPAVSLCAISLPLLVIQIAIVIRYFAHTWTFGCVVGAVKLEERIEKESEKSLDG